MFSAQIWNVTKLSKKSFYLVFALLILMYITLSIFFPPVTFLWYVCVSITTMHFNFRSLNFGGIGTFIGHAITRGFDNEGNLAVHVQVQWNIQWRGALLNHKFLICNVHVAFLPILNYSWTGQHNIAVNGNRIQFLLFYIWDLRGSSFAELWLNCAKILP